MQDDEMVVLVAEILYKPDESDANEAIIRADNSWDPPAEGTMVVVGVASIKLEPGSNRR